ncbi:MAG: hypothetical protein KatS3mg024_1444 [Armatimonadota bacterium]|nr:MAG: hypothetical protein KatS3mg024_1444 [Armatimonadota bacterium]
MLRRGACRLRRTCIGGLAAEQSRLRDKLRARKETQTTLVDGRAVGFLDPGSIPGASTIFLTFSLCRGLRDLVLLRWLVRDVVSCLAAITGQAGKHLAARGLSGRRRASRADLLSLPLSVSCRAVVFPSSTRSCEILVSFRICSVYRPRQHGCHQTTSERHCVWCGRAGAGHVGEFPILQERDELATVFPARVVSGKLNRSARGFEARACR